MPAETQAHKQVSDLRLWLSAFAPVLAWALHVSVSYGFVELYCQRLAAMSDTAAIWILGLFTVLMLLTALTGCLLSYRNRRSINRAPAEQRRGHFIATSGLLLGVFMVATILMQAFPVMVLPPCM